MNAGVQVKLWDPLRTRAIPERLRGVLTTRHYTDSRLPLPLPLPVVTGIATESACDVLAVENYNAQLDKLMTVAASVLMMLLLLSECCIVTCKKVEESPIWNVCAGALPLTPLGSYSTPSDPLVAFAGGELLDDGRSGSVRRLLCPAPSVLPIIFIILHLYICPVKKHNSKHSNSWCNILWTSNANVV